MTRARHHALLGLTLAALGAGGAARAAAQVAGDAVAPLHWDGEYALNVQVSGDTVTVRWMTQRIAKGTIQVFAGGRLRADTTFARADNVHAFTFLARGRPELTLRYGAAGDPADRHVTIVALDTPDRSRVSVSAPDSIVVISDVHGEFDRMIAVLRNAGVIDESLRWSGGHKHLVVIGDIFDRGPDATRALWFLYGLQRQAGGPGGRVHMMLGNHETMVMLDDLRYVSDKERAIAVRYRMGYDSLFDPRTSILGRWLVSRPALLRMGDLLFVHGGVSSDYARWTVEQVDDSLAAFMGEELFERWNDTTYAIPLDSTGYFRRWDFFRDSRSLFWYRGYLQSDTTEAELDSVLHAFRARAMVVGHTTGPHVRERFGGKLVAVNTLPFVIEAALLVRRKDGWDRFRIGETGPPAPLEPVADGVTPPAPNGIGPPDALRRPFR